MRRIALGFLVLSTTVAGAADFPGGAFGSKEGCIYAKTGDSSGADDFLLLDAKGITTSTAVCALKSAKPSGKSAFSLVIACESEGESGGDETAKAALKNDAWTVTVEDGTRWGPMKRCR